MKNKLAPSCSGRSAAGLRLYAVAALCAALLTVAVVASYAQRRTVVRVPGGAPAAEAPRREPESPHERAEERRRAAERTRARAAKFRAARQNGIVTQEIGVPTQGEPGVERTTEEIMASQPDVSVTRAPPPSRGATTRRPPRRRRPSPPASTARRSPTPAPSRPTRWARSARPR